MKKLILHSAMLLLVVLLISCEDNEETNLRSLPTVAFEVSKDLINLGESITLTDMSFDQDGTIASWHWDFGNDDTSTEQSPVYTYPDIGEFTISLTVTDNEENTNDNTFTKNVRVFSTSGTAPSVLWSYDVPFQSTHTSVAVSNETVYVVTDAKSSAPERGDNILAIKEGTLLWSDLTDDIIRMSPSIASDGTLLVGDYDGIFNAYSTDGSLKWSVNLNSLSDKAKDGFVKYSSPAIAADGTIYIGMENDNILFALNPDTGELIWEFPTGGDIRATPVIDSNGVIYIASTDDNLYAINPDGTLKWEVTYGTYTAGTPAISENLNRIYLTYKTSDNTGSLSAFNLTDGSLIWDSDPRPLAKMELGGPTIAEDGTIYAGGEDGKMVAYNTDGTIKWEYPTIGAESRILSAPALDNEGNIYFGDTDGYFYVVGPNGQNEWAPTQLNEEIRSSATIDVNGVIYILTRNNAHDTGKLYALETNATGLMNSEWPMLSKNANHTNRY